MATFGYTSVGGTTNANVRDFQVVSKETLTEGASVEKLTIYLDGIGSPANGVIKGLIYADSAGSPGALLGTSNTLSITVGLAANWYDLTFASPISLSTGTYWLGYITGLSTDSVQWNRYADTVSNNLKYKAQAYSSGPSDPFGTPGGTTNERISIYATYTAVGQLLAPTTDSVDGAWTDQSGGSSLFAAIDETTFSDADYIQSELSPSASGCRVKLASGSDPASSSGHEINWRAGKSATGGQTINMTVKLYQGGGNSLGGGTLIADFDRNAVDALTSYTETLSGGEADAITDYTDLYLEFWATV